MNYQTKSATMTKRLLLLISLLLSVTAWGKDVPKQRSGDQAFVLDVSEVLTPDQEARIITKLRRYFDSTSTQIAVLIEPSLGGEDIFSYTIKVANEWGIGEAEKDNGILIFIATADRKTFIQVGSGMEGAIPDAIAGRIVDYIMIPALKQGNYYRAVDEAIDALIEAAEGEFNEGRAQNGFPTWVIIVIIIIILIIITSFGNNNHRTLGGGRPYIGGGFGGGYMGGGGYSGGGGFSGGGFGGFGGGGFSGGGAGGSW